MKTKRRRVFHSKTMEDYFRHMRRKRLRKYRLPTQRHSKDYQLGYYIGEIIYEKYLPSTEICGLTTNHILEVDPADKSQYEKLYKDWSDYAMANYGDKKDKDPVIQAESTRLFNIQLDFWKYVALKVMPAEIRCDILPLPRRLDVAEFKQGIRDFLWDCDRCSYDINPENIIIGEEYWMQFIKLKLNVHV